MIFCIADLFNALKLSCCSGPMYVIIWSRKLPAAVIVECNPRFSWRREILFRKISWHLHSLIWPQWRLQMFLLKNMEKKPCLVSNFAFIFQRQLLGNLLSPLSPSFLAARPTGRRQRQRGRRARPGNTRFSLVITLNTLLWLARDEELSLSDIEKKLLLLYPGESKHLDDSQVCT